MFNKLHKMYKKFIEKHCWKNLVYGRTNAVSICHWCYIVPVRRTAGKTDTPVGLERDRPSSPSPRHRVTTRHCHRRRRQRRCRRFGRNHSRRRVTASGRLSHARHDWPTDGHGGVAWNVIDFFLSIFRVLLAPLHSHTRIT